MTMTPATQQVVLATHDPPRYCQAAWEISRVGTHAPPVHGTDATRAQEDKAQVNHSTPASCDSENAVALLLLILYQN